MLQRLKTAVVAVLILSLFFSGESSAVSLKSSLVGKHPRLLFSQADIAGLRAKISTPPYDSWYSGIISHANSVSTTFSTNLAPIDADTGQTIWWRMSSCAMAYVLSGNTAYADKCRNWMTYLSDNYPGTANWEYMDPAAFDTDLSVTMGNVNTMCGFAFAYDCVYDVLSDADRTKFRNRIKNQLANYYSDWPLISNYFTVDYQNNHVMHRTGGMILGALAILGEVAEAQAYADFAYTKASTIHEWEPPDGSNHEGVCSYQIYGWQYMAIVYDSLRFATDNNFLDQKFCKNMIEYFTYMTTPDFLSAAAFGDGAGTTPAAYAPGYSFFCGMFYLAAKFSGDGYAQAFCEKIRQKSPGAYAYYQWPYLWYDPGLATKDLTQLPTWKFFDDIDIMTVRSGWGDNDDFLAFHMGPFGGHRMNDVYRPANEYRNVAHDDPEEGTFVLYSKGKWLVPEDGYEKVSKLTKQHNTILIGNATTILTGGGQKRESGGWMQPLTPATNSAYMRGCAGSNTVSMASGDAHLIYTDMSTSGKFTRTMAYIGKKYFVFADNLGDTSNHIYEWRMHGEGAITNAGGGVFTSTNSPAYMHIKVLQPATYTTNISTDRNANVLALTTPSVAATNFLTLVWPSNEASVATIAGITEGGGSGVRVTRAGFIDTFLFNPAGTGINSSTFSTDGESGSSVETSGGSLIGFAFTKGKTFSFKGVNYVSSSNSVAVALDIKTYGYDFEVYRWNNDNQKIPSISSTLTVGGMVPDKTYYKYVDGTSNGIMFTSSASGTYSFNQDTTVPHKVIISNTSLGSFLMGDEALNFRCFPNPFNPTIGTLKIDSLPPDCTVKIYNASGELLITLNEADFGNLGFIEWNGKTSRGDVAARGIYMILAEGPGGKFRVKKAALLK